MKERPILFSGPMVRAILAGTKTQTRRAVHPLPLRFDHASNAMALDSAAFTDGRIMQLNRYGQPGDHLWVRETWQHSNHPGGPYDEDCMVFYRADYLDDVHGPDGEKSPEGRYRTWRPSIHMPRAASRITLEIASVRVERLQDISYEDAIAEGITDPVRIPPFPDQLARQETVEQYARRTKWPQRGYRALWEDINGPGTWAANPWVWVIEFKKVE